MPIQITNPHSPATNSLNSKPPPSLPPSTQQTAPTLYTTLPTNLTLAYRVLTHPTSTSPPLLLLQHFRGNMDNWDPLLINALASHRSLVLLDYAGVGKSAGPVASTYIGWAQSAVALLQSLQIPQVDLLGYSMGGLAAQMLALNHPALVRKLVLAATSTSIGADRVDPTDLAPFMRLASAVTDDEQLAANTECYYPPTPAGRLAAQESWTRLHERQVDRAPVLGEEGTKNQVAAWMHFSGTPEWKESSYGRLEELTMPVLVANGDQDVLMPTANSLHLARRIGGSRLAIYPGAGHGFVSQFAERFAEDVGQFLDEEKEETKKEEEGVEGQKA